MKELTTHNRVAGYLNKVFDMLNTEFLKTHFQDPPLPSSPHPELTGIFRLEKTPGCPSWELRMN